MSTKHTPGPWEAVTSWGDTFIRNTDGEVVFFLTTEDQVTPENIQLMASAPELLEALQICEGNIKSLLASAHPKVFGIWLDVVSAAITKATGEKS